MGQCDSINNKYCRIDVTVNHKHNITGRHCVYFPNIDSPLEFLQVTAAEVYGCFLQLRSTIMLQNSSFWEKGFPLYIKAEARPNSK